MKKALMIAAGFVVALQLLPIGRDHANPPVVQEPAWDKPETRALAKRACFDCHSNETFWPWYSNIAPVSWLVSHDVEEGREHLNFSEWNRPQKHAKDAVEEVEKGGMPIPIYPPLHPEARFTEEEKAKLASGLRATIGEEQR